MKAVRSSVVVCVYNRPVDVRRCVESLLAQDATGFEVVLVDDASTDDTPRVLDALARAHPERIRVVRNPVNLGVSGARNAGVDAAQGRTVLFLDSDCVAEPRWVAGLSAALDAGSDAVSGGVLEPPPRSWADRAFFGGLRVGLPGQGRQLAGCNMGFLREVLLTEPFDPVLRYTADEDDLARRLLALGRRIEFSPAAVVVHHHHMNAMGYLRTAWRQGAGSARYWYKHGMGIGRDLLFLFLALLSLPLALYPRGWMVPLSLLVLQLAALLYASVRFRRQSLSGATAVLPLILAYSAVKLASVLWTYLRIFLGIERATRASRRAWRARRRATSA